MQAWIAAWVLGVALFTTSTVILLNRSTAVMWGHAGYEIIETELTKNGKLISQTAWNTRTGQVVRATRSEVETHFDEASKIKLQIDLAKGRMIMVAPWMKEQEFKKLKTSPWGDMDPKEWFEMYHGKKGN